jgi:hypothetical protein
MIKVRCSKNFRASLAVDLEGSGAEKQWSQFFIDLVAYKAERLWRLATTSELVYLMWIVSRIV